MNKKQYNNVIEYTMKHEQSAQTDDSLSTARAIFDNMGVALPQGDIKAVYETIKTDDYMGWKSCTMQEAQAAADKGMAAIGISEDRIVVLSATDEEQPVTQTASVMTLSENTSAFAVDGLQYYSYSYVTTQNGGTTPNNPYTLVNGWLKLYHRPTVSEAGRVVEIPNVEQYTGTDGVFYQFTNKNYWYACENYWNTKINGYAINYLTSIGEPPVINTGVHGEYTNENGRYWMAVGPKVVDPNHQSNQMPYPENMYGKGVLDVVVKDAHGTKYYIPAVVGDVKGHTWSNGVIQTWKCFPDGAYDSVKNYDSQRTEYNGTVAAEFIGDFNLSTWANGLGNYSIDSFVFYPDPMQVKINNLVEWALGAEGKKLHECSEYFGVSNPNYGWCAWFVRLCGEKAGLNFGSSDAPTALSGVYGNVDFSSTNKPKVGDLAFIITHGESSIGHIGIVISIGNGQITTMEGNMSGSTDTSTVKKAYYSYETGVGDGYGRIARIGKNS